MISLRTLIVLAPYMLFILAGTISFGVPGALGGAVIAALLSMLLRSPR